MFCQIHKCLVCFEAQALWTMLCCLCTLKTFFFNPFFYFLEIPLQLLDEQIATTTTKLKCPLFLDKKITKRFNNLMKLDGCGAAWLPWTSLT